MRALLRRRLDENVIERPEAAAVGEALRGRPRFGDDVERFVEARLRFLGRNAESGELGVAVALADAEIEPAVRQQIERGRLFRKDHGVVPRQHHHGRAEPQRSRARRKPRQKRQRRRNLVPAGKVMLHEEGAVEAEGLGLDVELNEVVEALAHGGAGRAARLSPAEDAEPHQGAFRRAVDASPHPQPAALLEVQAKRLWRNSPRFENRCSGTEQGGARHGSGPPRMRSRAGRRRPAR